MRNKIFNQTEVIIKSFSKFNLKKRMIRQIRFDKFPKRVSTFRSQILSSLIVYERRPFDPSIPKVIVSDQTLQNTIYQLYAARKLNSSVKENLEFIQNTPNILVLQHEPVSLIIQQPIQYTLKQFLSQKQTQTGIPYMNETEARMLFSDLILSLESFQKNNLQYNCLNDHNVVRIKGKWMLSLAGVVCNSFVGDKNFYDNKKQGQQNIIYALGSLLFKILFGFVPFQQNPKKPQQFKFTNFIDSLEQQSIKKLPKIYYFADRIQLISSSIKYFIEQLLSSRMKSLFQLKNNKYFFSEEITNPKRQLIENKEIKMLNYFDKKYHSLIMAAIERKKKYPHQKLHPKIQSDTTGFFELQQAFAKDSFLKYLKFEDIRTQSEIKREEQHYNNLKIDCKYFDGEFDFEQKQRPTLELIKFIDKDRAKNPDLHQNSDRQARIKLYAYPYTMVFELANTYLQQPIEIKKKIEQLTSYLFEVSSLHWPVERLQCLHYTKLKHTKFQEIKIKYRELINVLYKHFLTEAMKRYNAKKQNLTIGEKIKLKEEGLEYYKLCLKLMQASLIVRKGGKDLDLQRIQTSQRKEIQHDLQLILKTYFPNRVEIK